MAVRRVIGYFTSSSDDKQRT